MKICFLWVERFKNLSNLSVSFCSEYQYSFDREKKLLTREEKSALPERLLETHISNITGVLGENGAGKTTLLELICLVTKAKDDINGNYIFVYKDKNEIYYYSSDGNNEIITSSFNVIHDHDTSHLDALNVIFFSNVYDEGFLNLNKSINDISVNMQVRYGYDKSVTTRQAMYSILDNHEASKFIKDLDFIKSDAFSYLKYPPPSRASIKINFYYWNKYTGSYFSRDENKVFKKLRDIFMSIIRREVNSKENFCNVIKLNLLARIYIESDCIDLIQKIFEDFLLENENYEIDSLIDNLFLVTEKEGHFIANILSEMLEIEHYLDQVDFKEEPRYRNNQIHCTIGLTKHNVHAFEKIAMLVHLMTRVNMQWAELSSGQRAYVNLFSSVWNALADNKNSDALVCIDEGDLYLHPQLQVEFIEKLVNVMPHLTDKEMQVIITTHSPLLVTDLPGQCLIILTKDENGLTQAKQGGKTFGANLYDIYRNTFGLNNQRTGNLSQNYINKIIQILDKKILTDIDITDLVSSLHIIGDKLLTYHIEKKLQTHQYQNDNAGGQYD